MKNDTHDNPEDSLLNALAIMALANQSRGVTRPEDEAILAYLSGDATPEECSQVRAALVQSAEFRGEFLEIAEDVDVLSSADAASRFDAMSVTDVPSREVFMREAQADTPEAPRPVVTRTARHVPLLERLGFFFRGPMLAYGLAVVFAVLWMWSGSGPIDNSELVGVVGNTLERPASLFVDFGEPGADVEAGAARFVVTLEPGLDAFVLLIRVPPRFVVDARFEATVESDNQPVHRFGQLQAQDGILHVTLAHGGAEELVRRTAPPVPVFGLMFILAVVFRALVNLDHARSQIWLGLAAACFLLGTMAWAWLAVPRLVRAPE